MFHINPVDVPIFLLCASASLYILYYAFKIWIELWLYYRKYGFNLKYFLVGILCTAVAVAMTYTANYYFLMYTTY